MYISFFLRIKDNMERERDGETVKNLQNYWSDDLFSLSSGPPSPKKEVSINLTEMCIYMHGLHVYGLHETIINMYRAQEHIEFRVAGQKKREKKAGRQAGGDYVS